MSVHVLLILLNELWKRDKMRGLLIILSLFHKEFNKVSNTRRARMLDSTVRCQIKVHKVNFKAKNNAKFQHL